MRNSPFWHMTKAPIFMPSMSKKVNNFSQFEYPEPRTVGFIGDSGVVGKSALINSLLPGTIKLLEELLRSFRQYYTDAYRKLTAVQEQQQITETDIQKGMGDTPNSLFRNHPGLTHESLSDEADGAEAAILTQFEEWAKAEFIHRPGGADALRYSVTANDPDLTSVETFLMRSRLIPRMRTDQRYGPS
ncbi:hypothetical protein T310_0964 [Rasamsonia emersonii CBS 393.64]|uniref:Uncharacterized protein n=1 Tax=Rasamsonia emersonii (strain ATCC 16479 / CBS 393.64 / IMI 116815) TaxID=1408163 RepID=A0A0F4Z518_RASE3|nr:hypothetical protein T310_0964 [Rasamsonia emersonii CBS 393.64]KKA24983.1 hypothetical protein T310_0964 [Rasamsonia emersonii CBS 393.64]